MLFCGFRLYNTDHKTELKSIVSIAFKRGVVEYFRLNKGNHDGVRHTLFPS